MNIEYSKAEDSDLDSIQAFVDFWLSGGGLADGVPGAGHDFFVPRGRHEAYLKKYKVLLAKHMGEIIGWAVKTKKGVLIHLLIAGTFRGQGIGSDMLSRIQPDVVRSKIDQSTGDPASFYVKHGFRRQPGERLGKRKNIEIFVRPGFDMNACSYRPRQAVSSVDNAVVEPKPSKSEHKRTIDVWAEKMGL